MKYPVLTILVVALIISCSSKNGTEDLSTTVKKTAENWPTAAWKYDTLRISSQFKPLLDSFPGKYSLLIVNNGKICKSYPKNGFQNCQANRLLPTKHTTMDTSAGFQKISALSVSCFGAAILHQQK